MNILYEGSGSQPGRHLLSCLKWLPVLLILAVAAPASAQPETTATTQASTEPTTATETDIFASDTPAVQSVMLLGETVSLDSKSPEKGPFPPLLEITTSTLLGSQAIDYTTQGVTIVQTAALVAAVQTTPPDIAVVFSGYTDEVQKVNDEQQRIALQSLVETLKSRNPAMRIFLVPAATTIGAITSANLRLVAADGNATFIPLGTEIGGVPYKEALQAIKVELSGEAEPAVVSERPAAGAYTRSFNETPAEPEPTPSAEFDKQKSQLQQELDRIAGESGNAQSLPSLADTVITTATDSATTDGGSHPAGGSLTKRGPEAKEAINMRPLPAVKAFRPQIPVPRNNLEKKEPALSR